MTRGRNHVGTLSVLGGSAPGGSPFANPPLVPLGSDQQSCFAAISPTFVHVPLQELASPLQECGVSAGTPRGVSLRGAPSAYAPLAALASCRLCPRECGVDRLAGERGFCGAGAVARVAAVSVHHGEEPPISGTRGSGTVFFSHCNMACRFCQNYPISQMGNGRDMDAEALADELVRLQAKGVHNVNFVTPTAHAVHLAEAVVLARERGFSIPVVYNTNGYDSLEALRLLDGIVDIYLPDAKYRSGELSAGLSGTPGYAPGNDAAIAEMVRQVGFLTGGGDGIATRGVLVRHLVLPGLVKETEAVLSRLAETFGPDLPLSLMGQYFPAWKAPGTPGLDRKLTEREYARAVAAAERLSFRNVFIQEL